MENIDKLLNGFVKSQEINSERKGCAYLFPFIILAIVCVIASIILNGLTVMLLWKWFIVPLGIVPISFVMALGISGFVRFLTHYPYQVKSEKKKDFEDTMISLIGESIIYPAFVLLFGYILSLFL